MLTKSPNVAGMFYPENSLELQKMLDGFLNEIPTSYSDSPKALIVPHAGYIYSGPIAAVGYKQLLASPQKYKRIVILSPSHYFPLSEIAVGNFERYQTPLGDIVCDTDCLKELVVNGIASYSPEAFEREHALEVHLPFLQRTLGDFMLLPFIVGRVGEDQICKLLDALDSPETLFIISSDLSHFNDYELSRRLDQATCNKIIEKTFQNIQGKDACGVYPLRGFLKWCETKGHKLKLLDYRNSGDTAGDKSRVVGYASIGAYASS